MDKYNQLVALYAHPGWEHFDSWIHEQVDDCIVTIMNPETPTDVVDVIRSRAYAYQSILDKVVADKGQLKQMQAQKE